MLLKASLSRFSASKLFLVAIASSMLCTISLATVYATAQNSPESQAQQEDINLNDLTLPSNDNYVVLKPGEKITGRLGLPAAKIIDPPPELAEEIAYWVAPKGGETPKPTEIAYEFNSSIRYRGSGHTIYVTTVRLTPAAAKLRRNLAKTTKLDDGTIAGVTVSCDSIPDKTTREGFSCILGEHPTPNQLVFERGNSVITIAGDKDLSIDKLKSLANKASIK